MTTVGQMVQAVSAVETAFILGKLEAAKRLEASILDVASLDEISQIGVEFIDEVHDDNQDCGEVF